MHTATKSQLVHDGPLTIATGRSRKELSWKNKDTKWSELTLQLGTTTRTRETVEEYKAMPKSERDDTKDVGGFVGGTLKGGRRKANNVAWRQIITLDADFVEGDIWTLVNSQFGYGCAMYSTHSHTGEKPRMRLVIPLKRVITPDEYGAIARKIAEDIGIDLFDDSTYEPHRLMYWPSTSADGEFVFKLLDKPWIDPDKVLARYKDWTDPSSWPESSRAKSVRIKRLEKQGDPREKKGIVGAFCRTYSVIDVLEKYLSDTYTPCADPNRYTYVEGSTAGGLVIYGDGDFAYSHHGSDPASGRLCNSFDLVRLHQFGDLDESAKEGTPIARMPSYLAMRDLAKDDLPVRKLIVAEKMQTAQDDFTKEDWAGELEINDRGEIEDTLTNIILIIRHEPRLKGIFYNELSSGIDVEGDLPWKRLKNGWNKTDEASLAGHLDLNYGIYAPGKSRDAVLSVAVERSIHPIKEYLNKLPAWDSVKRVDRLLIRYLGAEDNIYTQEVTRKTLIAAIARTMTPGIKFDTVLVLNGPQGIGKSTLFAKLGGKFFSDSLSIADMRDKTAAEKLQGYWILEIGELAGIRKIDEETLKSFLSRQDDKFRASYGYSVEDHPRQCIIVGTTNQEAGFLRDITGGRRFWPVKTPGGTKDKAWEMDEIGQIWAEALWYYKQKESLLLSSAAEAIANAAQIDALESDEREGIIREFLDKLLPSNWDQMDTYARKSFIRGDEFGDSLVGTVQRDQVCSMEIWCELFGREASAMKRMDSYEINAIMRKIDGWKKYDGNKQGRLRVPIYGSQRVYVRE